MFFIIPLVIIALDQGLKRLVVNGIAQGEHIPVISGFFYVTHAYNNGAAWSLFQGANIVFIPLTLLAAILIVYLMLKMNDKKYLFSFSLILGGALGNLIDRISTRFGVVDFVELHFGSYVFPIFNLADSCIVIGGILTAIWLFREKEAVTLATLGRSKNNDGNV